MTTTASAAASDATPVELPDSASGVLAAARARRAAADTAEAELLRLAVQWAIIHPAETLDDAESYTPPQHRCGDTGTLRPRIGVDLQNSPAGLTGNPQQMHRGG